MNHHRKAIAVICGAAFLDIAFGLAYAAVEHIPAVAGLYWAVTTATTVGYGDVVPHTPAGHLLAVAVMLTVIPLFGATFSLFTSGLTATHADLAEQRIKDHLAEHLGTHAATLKAHAPVPALLAQMRDELHNLAEATRAAVKP